MSLSAAAAAAMICTAAGVVFSSALKQRCEQLRLLSALTEEMSVKIRYRSLRLTELAEEIAGESTYSRCTFVRKLTENIRSGMQINDAWNDSAEKALFLADSDREILKNIGAQLGSSDTDGQLSLLSLGSSMISCSLEQAELDREKRSRMVLSVWTLCGIGAGIIII